MSTAPNANPIRHTAGLLSALAVLLAGGLGALGRLTWSGAGLAASATLLALGAIVAATALSPRASSGRWHLGGLVGLLLALAAGALSAFCLSFILPDGDQNPNLRAATLGLLVISTFAAGSAARALGREPLLGLRSLAPFARLATLSALLATAAELAGQAWMPTQIPTWLTENLPLGAAGLASLLSLETTYTTGRALFRRLRTPSLIEAPPAMQARWVPSLFPEDNLLRGWILAVESKLGLDISTAQAIATLRRGAEPALWLSVALTWATTSLQPVLPHESGVHYRLGALANPDPLPPGLHLILPWPIDRLDRVETGRIHRIGVGHPESAPEPGPESRFWAKQHGKEEFTLLLGNGKDLVSLDGELLYRIQDPVAWRTTSQNPEAALEAFAYEAVMRRTVDRDLAGVLSDRLQDFTVDVHQAVQTRADVEGLGVEVLRFSLTALHPPVAMAEAYQNVVSAQIQAETSVIEAHAQAARTLSVARSAGIERVASSKAAALERRSAASVEAAGFTGLRASIAADPALFRLRHRLERVERALQGQRVLIIDHRIEQEGGELWIQP